MNPRLVNLPCHCGGVVRVVQCRPNLGGGVVDCECVCNACGEYSTCQVAQQLLAQFAQPLWTPESEPTPEPEPDAPVIHGSVIGYRAFTIRDWKLGGTGVNRTWEPGVNEATCNAGDGIYGLAGSPDYGRHGAPALGCHCGITALARFAEHDTHWSPDSIRGAIEAWSDETLSPVKPGDVAEAAGVSVTTKVLGSMFDLPPDVIGGEPAPDHDHGGRFILHGTGFRAQYGKVVLLAVDDDWPAAKKAAVRALAREHEADVCKHAHLEDAAKEHGQLVPDDMLAWAKEGDPDLDISPRMNAAMIALAGQMQVSMRSLGVSVQQASAAMSGLSTGWNALSLTPQFVPYGHRKRTKGPRPTGTPGICQTLGYNGPPSHGKFKKNNRVRDRAGDIWQCVRGGQPGTWEREEG